MAQANEMADNGKDFYTKSELYRIQADLLKQAATASNAEIEAAYQQAIDLASDYKLSIFQLRAAISLSYLWQEEGKNEEARQLLTETYNTFTEGFDTKDLQEAAVLMQNL